MVGYTKVCWYWYIVCIVAVVYELGLRLIDEEFHRRIPPCFAYSWCFALIRSNWCGDRIRFPVVYLVEIGRNFDFRFCLGPVGLTTLPQIGSFGSSEISRRPSCRRIVVSSWMVLTFSLSALRSWAHCPRVCFCPNRVRQDLQGSVAVRLIRLLRRTKSSMFCRLSTCCWYWARCFCRQSCSEWPSGQIFWQERQDLPGLVNWELGLDAAIFPVDIFPCYLGVVLWTVVLRWSLIGKSSYMEALWCSNFASSRCAVFRLHTFGRWFSDRCRNDNTRWVVAFIVFYPVS